MKKATLKRSVLFVIMAAVLILSAAFVLAAPSYAAGKASVSITAQPKDLEVEYPEEAEFHVEVDNPDNVASWQWEQIKGIKMNPFNGESAVTDTLVRCVITDKDGNTVSSEQATLTVLNMESGKNASSPFTKALAGTVIVAVCVGGAMMLSRMGGARRKR